MKYLRYNPVKRLFFYIKQSLPEFKPVKSGNLSKKFLMELDEGLYLVINISDNSYKPVFAEEVLPLEIREKQWKRIVNKKANNRLCEVFPSKDILNVYNFKRFLNGLMS